jgi:hypothetical protein
MTDYMNGICELNHQPFTSEERSSYIESYIDASTHPVSTGLRESIRDRLEMTLQMGVEERVIFLLKSYIERRWGEQSIDIRQRIATLNGRPYSAAEIAWQHKGVLVMNSVIKAMVQDISEGNYEAVWLSITYLSEGIKWQVSSEDVSPWWCAEEGLCWGSPEWADVKECGPEWWGSPLVDPEDFSGNFVKTFLPGWGSLPCNKE